MWQICPKCKGSGKLFNPSLVTEKECNLCNGKMIISELTGLPPLTPSVDNGSDFDIDKIKWKNEIDNFSNQISKRIKIFDEYFSKKKYNPIGILLNKTEDEIIKDWLEYKKNRQEIYTDLETNGLHKNLMGGTVKVDSTYFNPIVTITQETDIPITYTK